MSSEINKKTVYCIGFRIFYLLFLIFSHNIFSPDYTLSFRLFSDIFPDNLDKIAQVVHICYITLYQKKLASKDPGP